MKKLALLLLVAVMIISAVACTPKTPSDTTKDDKKDNGVIEPAPAEKTKVSLYFVNQEYVTTGDESLEKLILVEREVELGNKTVEEVILAELQKKPEDEKLTTTVDKLKILSVKVDGDEVKVDISSENLNGGSMEEALILQQIVYSLTELPTIDEVQLLVDGEKQETLMGHFSIDEPLDREDI